MEIYHAKSTHRKYQVNECFHKTDGKSVNLSFINKKYLFEDHRVVYIHSDQINSFKPLNLGELLTVRF